MVVQASHRGRRGHHGGRFNPKGMPALYLGLDPMTAIMEAAQGFPRKSEPLVLCTYEIDCEDFIACRIEDEQRTAGVETVEIACPWFAEAATGREPGFPAGRQATPGRRRRGTDRAEFRP